MTVQQKIGPWLLLLVATWQLFDKDAIVVVNADARHPGLPTPVDRIRFSGGSSPGVVGGSSTQAAATTTATTTTSDSPPSTTRRPESGGIPRSLSSSSSSSSLSLSDPQVVVDDRWNVYPPWNPSRRINDDGFVMGLFDRIPGEWETEVRLRTAHGLSTPCRIRQVPGDGNCLFHSISLCLCHAENGTHWDMKTSLPQLYQHSQQLRQQAVACLRGIHVSRNPPHRNFQQQHQHHRGGGSAHHNTNAAHPHHNSNSNGMMMIMNNKRLVLQGQESVQSRELVEAAARQYGLTSEEYCQDMLQESVWGGGPEIVALANVLKRPIHVYELRAKSAVDDNDDNNHDGNFSWKQPQGGNNDGDDEEDEDRLLFPKSHFCLRRMACFGSPKFDRRRALHILSADSRFPDIKPGKHLSDGNHFLAVFPIDYDDNDDDDDGGDHGSFGRRKRRLLRGGSFFWGGGGSSASSSRHRHSDFSVTPTQSKDYHRFFQNYHRNTFDDDDDDDEDDDNIDNFEETEPFQWMGGWWRRTFLNE
ncbi:hypothetical protein ACA910_018506 [Epithemia clementina (nom. ined.)]